MHPTALLIAGSETRFAAEIDRFRAFIEPRCCSVSVSYFPTVRELRAQLRQVLEEAPSPAPVLIGFCGHGSPHGWEVRGVFSKLFYYETLVRLIAASSHRVLVLNSCCYGQHLAAKAMRVRDLGYRMSVLADWEGFDECRPRLFEDAVAAWSAEQFIENVVGGYCYASENYGDVDFSPLFRWGPILDHHFFPAPAAAAANVA